MGTPIPHISNEMKGRGASEVVTYRLTPEEIAALSPARPIPRSHTKQIGFETDMHQPQLKRKENDDMAESKLTKEQYLKLRVEGKTRKEIAKLNGYTLSHLESYWLKKWGIKDELQEEIAIAEAFAPASDDGDVVTPGADNMSGTAVLTEPTGLIAYNSAREVSTLEDLAAKIKLLEVERDDFAAGLLERDRKILELNNLIGDTEKHWIERVNRLEVSIAELEDEREMLLKTIEHAATPSTVAGHLDVMDIVEAAVIGLNGGQAYSTGAALEHLWTWSPKDGIANLLKARRHIDRLIAGQEAEAK